MAELRLHKRNILTDEVHIFTDEVTIIDATGPRAVVVFDDEPDKKRWFIISDGKSQVDCSRFNDWWVDYVEEEA